MSEILDGSRDIRGFLAVGFGDDVPVLTDATAQIKGDVLIHDLTDSALIEVDSANDVFKITPTVSILSIGENAGTNGAESVFVGGNAGYLSTNPRIICIGKSAGYNNSSTYLTSIGYFSSVNNSGWNLTAIGRQSAYGNSGNNVSGVGSNCLENNTGDNVTATGGSSARDNIGDNVTVSGYFAGYRGLANYLTAFGTNRGVGANYDNLTLIGNVDNQVNNYTLSSFLNITEANVSSGQLTLTGHGYTIGDTVSIYYDFLTGASIGISEGFNVFTVIDANTLGNASLANNGAMTGSVTIMLESTGATALGFNAGVGGLNSLSIGTEAKTGANNTQIYNSTGVTTNNAVANTATFHTTDANPDFGIRSGVPETRGYTIATLPSAVNSRVGMVGFIIVTDTVRGQVMASSDGTNWLYTSDGIIIS